MISKLLIPDVGVRGPGDGGPQPAAAALCPVAWVLQLDGEPHHLHHLPARPKIRCCRRNQEPFCTTLKKLQFSESGNSVGVMSPPQYGLSTSGLGFTEMC